MHPSLSSRERDAFYIYDELSKELLYASASQQDMAKIQQAGISPSNFSEYKKNQIKYLGRFIFSGSPLNSEEYSENILDTETLQEFVKSISKEQRLKLASPAGGCGGTPPCIPPGGGGERKI